MNKLIASTAAAANLLGMSLPPARAAYTILPPGAVVAGKSIADWTADWWTWGLQAPETSSPLTDPTGGFAHVNNNGPVFFIAGQTSTRQFTVPFGKPILLPIINLFDVEPAPEYSSPTLAQRVAASQVVLSAWESNVVIASLFATIDGTPVPSPESYLQELGLFDMGPVQEKSHIQALFGLPTGTGTSPTNSTGYWLMITDLPVGTHELHFGGRSESFSFPNNCCNSGTFPEYATDTFDTIVVTPEPATLALLGVSSIGLVALRRRRRAETVVA